MVIILLIAIFAIGLALLCFGIKQGSEASESDYSFFFPAVSGVVIMLVAVVWALVRWL